VCCNREWVTFFGGARLLRKGSEFVSLLVFLGTPGVCYSIEYESREFKSGERICNLAFAHWYVNQSIRRCTGCHLANHPRWTYISEVGSPFCETNSRGELRWTSLCFGKGRGCHST
jgi:hypothetical protein